MTKRIASLTSTILLAIGIAAFTGSALAGNGNGSGKADTQTASANESASQAATGNSADAHGNSANAPGQIKQDTVSTHAAGGGSADQNAGAEAGAKPTSAGREGQQAHVVHDGRRRRFERDLHLEWDHCRYPPDGGQAGLVQAVRQRHHRGADRQLAWRACGHPGLRPGQQPTPQGSGLQEEPLGRRPCREELFDGLLLGGRRDDEWHHGRHGRGERVWRDEQHLRHEHAVVQQ
jgi:hypothetical protein